MFPYRPTALISVREQREECCGTGPAFSPEANLVFVNSIEWCSTVKLDTKAPVFEAGKPFLGSANAYACRRRQEGSRRRGILPGRHFAVLIAGTQLAMAGLQSEL